MKKRLLSAFLAIVIALSCFGIAASAFKGKYVAKDHLTKTVLAKKTIVDSRNHTKTVEKYSYNSKGCLTKSTKSRVTPKGDSETGEYTYDSKGNIVKRFYYVNGKRSNTPGSYTYKYDSKGRLIKKTETYPIYGAHETTKYSYNSKGLVSEAKRTYYGDDGYTTVSSNKYKYNSKNRLIEDKLYGSENRTTKYKYDSKGNLIHEDKGYEKTGFKYDSASRLIKKVTKSGDSVSTTVYSYNSKGKLIKEVEKSSSGYSSKTVRKYNSKGYLAKEKETSSYGDNTTVTYSYKKVGKAICRTGDGVRLNKYQYKYNGKARKPLVFFDETASDETLRKGVDYKLLYSNNVKPGNAKVRVRFINPENPELFGKTFTIVFKILPA